jgi:hypothetical protein
MRAGPVRVADWTYTEASPPPWWVAKAISVPSGDHIGFSSVAFGSTVNRVGTPCSRSNSQMLLGNRSSDGDVRWNRVSRHVRHLTAAFKPC